MSSDATTLPQVSAIRWQGGPDGYLVVLDQTQLPTHYVQIECRTAETVWEAIRILRVRGAPAIGIAAAYGVCLGLQPYVEASRHAFFQRLEDVIGYLSTSRPTAVNLFWALERMRRRALALPAEFSSRDALESLWKEAELIRQEDRAMCRAIGRWGAPLLRGLTSVLTHCNTGSLATAEYGTALAVIFTAQDEGNVVHVYVDETRPLLQGARLTTWELQQRGIPCTLVCDSVAAWLMRTKRVQAVLVGADRITANGDTANKIGTYGLAVLARAHAIPFYVAAPSSTFDLSLTSGDLIPIEERSPREITEPFGKQIAPQNTPVYNPAFDITPAELITAIVTQYGIIQPVNENTIREHFADRDSRPCSLHHAGSDLS